jgi:altronate dehydratase large subunit
MNATFQGFHRPDGSVGARNYLLILSVTGLTGPTARRIGRAIPTARVVTTPYGSGLLGEDGAVQMRALIGLACHPNVGAALIVGAHPPQVHEIVEIVAKTGKPVEPLILDDNNHDALTMTDRGTRLAARLAREISRARRAPAPASSLSLAMECGRSDPSSGLVANPLVGRIADRVIAAGGRTMIGETTEWLGAEHLLATRAAHPAVAEAVKAAVNARERFAVDSGIDLVGNNPGPTNIAAGLSTIEEKSLGAIAKGGTTPIQSVLKIAEAPKAPGLHLMDAPSYSPESVTGMVAAGAQLVLFTTGVGNSYVSAMAPTIKISGNPETTARLHEQLDFDASAVFRGRMTSEEAADVLFETLLDVASGTLTWGEILDEGEEVISRMGPAL